MPVSASTKDREQEMKRLRDRYQSQRKGVPPTPSPVNVEESTEPKKIIIEAKQKEKKNRVKPYLFIIENDIRRLFRMKQKIWEKEKKPLDLSWLEKNGGKLFR
jgi:hypothetical protein